MRGSQGSGRDRPAIEGTSQRSFLMAVGTMGEVQWAKLCGRVQGKPKTRIYDVVDPPMA